MKYLYSICVLLILASCGKEEKPIDHSKTDWAFYKLKGNVERITEKSFAIDSLGKLTPKHEDNSQHDTEIYFSEDGRLKSEKRILQNGKLFEEIKYQGKDKKLEYLQYANRVLSVKTVYDWDKSGKFNTAITRRNPDNTQLTRIETRFKGGNPVEKKVLNDQNNLQDRVEYLYNKDNKLHAENYFGNKEAIQFRTVYEYDAEKRKISEIQSDPTGKMLSKATYEYDKDKVTSKINYDEKNEVSNYEKLEYDNKGNIITQTGFSKMDGEMRNIYTYDKNGNQTSWSVTTNGKPEMRVLYEYDKFNNLISQKVSYGNGNLSDTRSYRIKYDKKGNWIKKTVSINNKVKYIIKRDIKYYK